MIFGEQINLVLALLAKPRSRGWARGLYRTLDGVWRRRPSVWVELLPFMIFGEQINLVLALLAKPRSREWARGLYRTLDGVWRRRPSVWVETVALYDIWRTDQLSPGTSGEAAIPGMGAGTIPDFGQRLATPPFGLG